MSVFISLQRKQKLITTEVYEHTELHFNPLSVMAYMYTTKTLIKSK